MRVRRGLLIDGTSVQYFHVVSRVVDRRFIFEERERAVFHRMMRQIESFSGVAVMAYSLMGNHFHLLLKVVPVQQMEMGDGAVWERMKHLYNSEQMSEWEEELNQYRNEGKWGSVEDFYEGFRRRMGKLSEFVKELKQRFSIWYNAENGRKGTLWEERFRSVLIDGAGHSLLRVASYIEMNAVRAGVVRFASDFRWCSYSEARHTGGIARKHLLEIARGIGLEMPWGEAEQVYSSRLRSGSPNQVGAAEAAGEVDNFCRHRYYTEGLVIGSREFIEDFYKSRKGGLCRSRRVISYPVLSGADDELYTYRNVL